MTVDRLFNEHPSGCAHAQQLIWQLFNTVEKGIEAAGDTDSAFLEGIVVSCSLPFIPGPR